ncbi:MAG: ankyrin repeat domain-containing protein [Treponema sp.]|jgi:ankyrin repeat protein|nr:ankyrin repeat domain-containing protein [Treponema sp.]
MKKALFYHALFSVILTFILFVFAGCASKPAAEVEPDKDNIWDLLRQGDAKAKDYFISEVEVNAVDSDGRSPLHYAAERGDAGLAGFFISLGANPNVLDYERQSPLGISIDKSDTKTSEVFLKGKADIHLPILNDTSAAKLALAKGGPIFRSILTPSSVESVDSDGATILHLASRDGRFQAVSEVLAVIPLSANIINKTDNNKKNALDYALEKPESKNHIDIAEQLILKGAASDNRIYSYFAPAVRSGNYNLSRSEGLSPIHYAVMDNYYGLFMFLIERNIDVNIKSSSGSTPLHEAARTGNINFMRMLIERGANVNSADAKGNTPLHMVIPANVHREAVAFLLQSGANPNLRDEHGDTPLHIMIIVNRPVEVIQTLLGGGSDVHIRNMDGKTPLYIAIQEKRTTLIPHLLSYGSEIFAADNSGVTPFTIALSDHGEIFPMIVTPETVNQRDTAGNTMLHSAVRYRGSQRHIGIILDQRSLVDARNRVGDTALHIAVRMNQRENGEFLISRGASIFTLNSAGESPLYLALTSSGGIRMWMLNSTTIVAKDGLGNNILHYAAQWKLDNVIPVIIQRGVPVEEANATGETPLFMAVKSDSPSTITALLKSNANLNARDKQGNSPLHTAVRWNSKQAASALISSGIDINAYSMNGGAALHDAVLFGMSDIEDLLLKEGANLEVRNVDGNTPFMEAVRAGLTSSIEKLAAKGADTSARNNNGDTPLHFAVAAGKYDSINTLLRLGASIHARNTSDRTPFQNSIHISPKMVFTLLTKNRINIPDDMGSSALHIALQEKASSEIIKTIIGRGVRVNAIDRNGQTPLRMAVDMNLLEAVKILADAGADPFIAASDNRTTADIAFTKGEECIKAIFSGSAINTKDSSANTILHFAARYGNPQIIRTLLDLGANKSLRNIASESPVDIAVRWNRSDNADVLR